MKKYPKRGTVEFTPEGRWDVADGNGGGYFAENQDNAVIIGALWRIEDMLKERVAR